MVVNYLDFRFLWEKKFVIGTNRPFPESLYFLFFVFFVFGFVDVTIATKRHKIKKELSISRNWPA